MPVSLGFLEQCDSWKLESRFFPSKVGGKPAWLSLDHLPSSEELTCNKCNKVLVFLCQVYAPFENETAPDSVNLKDNFHRTIFVFVCRNPSCYAPGDSSTIKVYRNNLPRENDFYSKDPPEDVPYSSNAVQSSCCKLCNLCGIVAHQQCSKCKKVVYCCKEHQVLDWKSGHKLNCTVVSEFDLSAKSSAKCVSNSPFFFNEFELVNEMEELESAGVDEQKELEEFSKLEGEGKAGTLSNIPDNVLENYATQDSDKVFAKFRKRTAQFPDQVLRYDKGGEPLLIAKEPIPTSVPDCEYCGAPRQFEFQVMPQLLSELERNQGWHSIDWGVLLIYTCKNSCQGKSVNSYKKEFVFKQDVAQ